LAKAAISAVSSISAPDPITLTANEAAKVLGLAPSTLAKLRLLGGSQGIGKDTLLEPVKYAIGPWNFTEVSPTHMFGRFNGFVRSVILRISEARDLGDVNRFAFYEHMKIYLAAPPDVLRCDEKKPAGVFGAQRLWSDHHHKS